MGRLKIIASGNLAARRTIVGVQAMFEEHRLPRSLAVEMLHGAGLPARAVDDPDFPISIAQQLRLTLAVLKHIGSNVDSVSQVFGRLNRYEIGRFGLVGLAMQTAPSLAASFRAGLRHPELVWGHTRMSIHERGDALRIRFNMLRPFLPGATEAEIDRLVAYCILQDLISVVCISADVMGGACWPDRIDLPSPRPGDWDPAISPPAAAVRFGASSATLCYPAALLEAAPVKANRVSHAACLRAAQRLAEPLSDNAGVAEQTARWLWASTPPLKRAEIADLLGMSERSLARRLEAEKTSYNRLLAEVQAERAKNLLRDPSATAASVAYRLGYTDPAAFSRAFAGWTGAAPGAWRKAALCKNAASPARR